MKAIGGKRNCERESVSPDRRKRTMIMQKVGTSRGLNVADVDIGKPTSKAEEQAYCKQVDVEEFIRKGGITYGKKDYGKQAYLEEQWDTAPSAAEERSSSFEALLSGGGSTEALVSAQSHAGPPLKILCLHGGGGNARDFEHCGLAILKRQLGPLVHFVCVDAPHKSPTMLAHPDNEWAGYLWQGDPTKQGLHSVGWWDESVRMLKRVIAEQGPFDGVLGYSMGACAAFSLLTEVPENTFKFTLLACGYVPTNDPKLMEKLERRKPLNTPTLNMMGRNDYVIPNKMTLAMIEYLGDAELCRHPGQHELPRDAQHLDQMAAFLLRFVEAV